MRLSQSGFRRAGLERQGYGFSQKSPKGKPKTIILSDG
jgi:hypothetical protein